MLMGHYSAAFVAKAVAPRTPLWTLFVAVQFVDILWASFIMTGLERARIDSSLPSNALVLYDMPYTHSLLATVMWAVVAGLLASTLGRKLGEGWVIGIAVGLCVVSHWLLDLLVHRPDLVVFADGPGLKVGLGLWDMPVVATALEVLLILGAALWLWLAHPPSRSRALVLLVGALAIAQIALTIAPHPPTVEAIAASALASFIILARVVAWLESRYGGLPRRS